MNANKKRLSFFWRRPKKVSNLSEQGLTLLETLVGILIITLVLAASTPPILLAAATRIQNRRAEQAMQIAQQELDRVRLIMERDASLNEELPPADTSITNPDNIKNVVAPASVCPPSSSSCTPYPAFNEVRVSEDENFLIQVFREKGIQESSLDNSVPPTDPTPNDGQDRIMAFRLGVRVYSNSARSNLGTANLSTEVASLQITGGPGQQITRPLAVLYGDFARSDLTLSLKAYRSFTR